jgi:hypothetical protein
LRFAISGKNVAMGPWETRARLRSRRKHQVLVVEQTWDPENCRPVWVVLDRRNSNWALDASTDGHLTPEDAARERRELYARRGLGGKLPRRWIGSPSRATAEQ